MGTIHVIIRYNIMARAMDVFVCIFMMALLLIGSFHSVSSNIISCANKRYPRLHRRRIAARTQVRHGLPPIFFPLPQIRRDLRRAIADWSGTHADGVALLFQRGHRQTHHHDTAPRLVRDFLRGQWRIRQHALNKRLQLFGRIVHRKTPLQGATPMLSTTRTPGTGSPSPSCPPETRTTWGTPASMASWQCFQRSSAKKPGLNPLKA